MAKQVRKCPQCQSTDLQCEHLGIPASPLPVQFGTQPFKKQELLAYACKKCGFVFLYLEVEREDT